MCFKVCGFVFFGRYLVETAVPQKCSNTQQTSMVYDATFRLNLFILYINKNFESPVLNQGLPKSDFDNIEEKLTLPQTFTRTLVIIVLVTALFRFIKNPFTNMCFVIFTEELEYGGATITKEWFQCQIQFRGAFIFQ